MRFLSCLPRLACVLLALAFASCGSVHREFRNMSITLPGSWQEASAPVPGTFAAVDASRDGADLLLVIPKRIAMDPRGVKSATLRSLGETLQKGTIAGMTSKGAKNVKTLGRSHGQFGGVPAVGQVFGATLTYRDGQAGDVVISSRVYLTKGELYNVSLRESAESHRQDPGYFERLMQRAVVVFPR